MVEFKISDEVRSELLQKGGVENSIYEKLEELGLSVEGIVLKRYDYADHQMSSEILNLIQGE